MKLPNPEEPLLALHCTENERSLSFRFLRSCFFLLSLGLFFLLSPLFVAPAWAQPALPTVFHLSEKDGLGTRLDPSIVEDKKRGFIWIGAKSGIWRYDGETVVKGWPKPKKNDLRTDTYLAITLLLADSTNIIYRSPQIDSEL